MSNASQPPTQPNPPASSPAKKTLNRDVILFDILQRLTTIAICLCSLTVLAVIVFLWLANATYFHFFQINP